MGLSPTEAGLQLGSQSVDNGTLRVAAPKSAVEGKSSTVKNDSFKILIMAARAERSEVFACPRDGRKAFAALRLNLDAEQWLVLCDLFKTIQTAQTAPSDPTSLAGDRPPAEQVFTAAGLDAAARGIRQDITAAIARGDLPHGSYEVVAEFHEEDVLVSDLSVRTEHHQNPVVREQLRRIVQSYQIKKTLPGPNGPRTVMNFHLSIERPIS
jgi:hypothetical protein